MAQYFNNTDIEIIIKPPERLKIRYAIFDNDGTISTLREGWEKIMAPMMEKVILGEKTRMPATFCLPLSEPGLKIL